MAICEYSFLEIRAPLGVVSSYHALNLKTLNYERAPVSPARLAPAQRLQYPLIREYSLNHIRDPNYNLRYIP